MPLTCQSHVTETEAEIELQAAISQVSSEIEANTTEIGQRSMATIGQVRASEEKASEIEALLPTSALIVSNVHDTVR